MYVILFHELCRLYAFIKQFAGLVLPLRKIDPPKTETA
jgi:hypothetical protein